jgi:hypothetical protein
VRRSAEFPNWKLPFKRTKSQRNLNDIGVRSFILTGAPFSAALKILLNPATQRLDSAVSRASSGQWFGNEMGALNVNERRRS